MIQVVGSLPSKCEALSSNPNTTQNMDKETNGTGTIHFSRIYSDLILN
jgi:hypothetical protein